jgi:phosphomannomutase
MDAESNHAIEPATDPVVHEIQDETSDDLIQLPVLPELTPVEPQYRCPGETHSISRAVHLSRLASFFPACRECQHRTDTGELPPQTVERIQQVERRMVRQSVFQQDGIRGVFLNELTPAIAGRVVSALARIVWDQIPLPGKTELRRPTRSPVQPARTGPAIVVGYDERPSSPSVLAAVIDALRMMSCQVVDVGLVSKPCFCFAVDHLQASGGVFVTGSNCEAAWTGLDLYSSGALPIGQGTGLEEIEHRFNTGVSRPTRRASYQRSFQAVVPYEAGLWKHFHALRPLRIVVAARPRPVRKTLRRLFKKLPCQLIEVETTGAANAPIRAEIVSQRVKARIKKRDAHLGVLIHDDGCRTEFFDEEAQRIPQAELCRLLSKIVRAQEPRSNVIVDSSIASTVELREDEFQECDSSIGAIAEAMKSSQAVFGASADDRYWFREAYPACDALLTVARVLESLSLSDASFSSVIRNCV